MSHEPTPTNNAIRLPRLDEYFGPWAMHLETLLPMVDRVNKMDLTAHVQAHQQQAPLSPIDGFGGPTRQIGSVAVIDAVGVLMKQATSLTESTSTVALRRQLRAAGDDDAIQKVLLFVSSPGGAAAGTPDAARDVAELAAKKPVLAFVEDLGASAAYWLASQASEVWATETSLVGSIGTYGVLVDESEAAAMKGLKVHVVKAGEFKGAGEPGTVITPEQLAEKQRIVNQLNSFFTAGVRTARGMTADEMKTASDGRAFIASEAKAMKLIDRIGSIDEAMARLESSRFGKPAPATRTEITPTTEHPMSEPTPTTPAAPGPASYAELKAALPNEDAEFYTEAMDKGMTLTAASAFAVDRQRAKLEARDAEIAELKADAARNKPKRGVPATGDAGGGKQPEPEPAAADPAADFKALMDAALAKPEAQTAAGRAKVMRDLVHQHPEAHAAFVAAQPKVQR